MKNLMIFSVLIVIISALLNLCNSQKFVDSHASHPDHPDKCFYKSSGHIFGVGQFHRQNGKEGGCYAYECQAPGTIAAWGCPEHEPPAKCKRLRKDSFSPHPHCCERYLCTDKDGEYFIVNPAIRADLEELKDAV